MINDIVIEQQIDADGRDVFATKDVTISVTCKPKYVYSSSATHWANDAYKDRLLFPEEHEIHGTGADVSRKGKTGLVFLQDTVKQFDLYMNIPGDYRRIVQGDAHREREKLRVQTLHARIKSTKVDLEQDQHTPHTTSHELSGRSWNHSRITAM